MVIDCVLASRSGGGSSRAETADSHHLAAQGKGNVRATTSGKLKGNDNVIYTFIYAINPYSMYHNYIQVDHAIYSLGALTALIKPIMLLVLTIQISLLDLTIMSQNCEPYNQQHQVSNDYK